MRTTLKRGIGRGAAFDGNGHAVLPPTTVPLTPVEVRRYIQPPPAHTRGRLIGAVVGYIVLGMVTISGGVLGGFYLAFHETVHDVSAHSPGVKSAQQQLVKLSQPNQPATTLIIGYDHRAGIESDMPSRSDTVMLVRADPSPNNPDARSISMISFPRDMRVDIHCPGKSVYRAKINSAYEACGETGTLETVEALTGLSVNYLITVNFHGFKQIVDKLGGVWVDVDHRYYNKNVGTAATAYANINLWPGYQKLNGAQALDYVRFRHTDSDLYRVARQQVFIEALKQQAEAHLSPAKIDGVIGALRRNVEIGIGGGGELDFRTLLTYANFVYSLPDGHFFRGKLENLTQDTSSSDLFYDPTSLANAIHEFVAPPVDAPKEAAAAAGIHKAAKKKWTPAPAKVATVVLNGNGISGSAGTASGLLAGRGYKMILPPTPAQGNAPNFQYFKTVVYFDPTWGPGKLAADGIATLFGDAAIDPMTPDIAARALGARIVVVVGSTFHGTIATGPRSPTIVHKPPNVRKALDETLPLVRAQRKHVPFQLAAPALLDTSSRLDRYVPVRYYPLDKDHEAVRLVFKSALDAGGYWGIQESDWAEAPALAHPSYTRVLHGRTYDFYLSGAHVHMVVAHGRGDVRYWVVNTLGDLLSNETMISVAKSLRVLPR